MSGNAGVVRDGTGDERAPGSWVSLRDRNRGERLGMDPEVSPAPFEVPSTGRQGVGQKNGK